MKKLMFLIMISCLLVSGCAVADEKIKNEIINFSEPGGEISIDEGQTFSISLESNQTTGYKWVFAKPLNIKMLGYKGTVYETPETDRLGAGGIEVWTFKAISPGIAMIVLKYVRPWERDKYPLESRTYIIKVKPGKEQSEKSEDGK